MGGALRCSQSNKWGNCSFKETPVQGFFLYTFYAFHVSEISEKLSFWVFGTEFFKNLGGFGQKSKFLGWFWLKISLKTQFLIHLELSFWAKTEFSVIFWIWVFENPELSFLVLNQKKACAGANVQTYQVGARFEALTEGVLMAPLDPRYRGRSHGTFGSQVHSSLI